MRRNTANARRQTRTPAMAGIGNTRRPARVSGSFGNALSRRSHQCAGIRENTSSDGGGKTSRDPLWRPAQGWRSAPRVTSPARSRVAAAGVASVMRRWFPALRRPSKPSGTTRNRGRSASAWREFRRSPSRRNTRACSAAGHAAFAPALGCEGRLGKPPQPPGDVERAVRPFNDPVVGAAAGGLAGERDQARATEGPRQRPPFPTARAMRPLPSSKGWTRTRSRGGSYRPR